MVYLVDKPGAVQSVARASAGAGSTGRDPRYFATLIGNHVLGGDFLSRLNQNLREKNGFTYGAGSAFSFRRTGSVWAVSTQVRADATGAGPEGNPRRARRPGRRPSRSPPRRSPPPATPRPGRSPRRSSRPGAIAGILAEIAQFHLPPDYLDTFLDRLQATRPQ